ncbi:MAG TPA: autotransporter domain-containing protein [Steroidobacteraceae bacterium]
MPALAEAPSFTGSAVLATGSSTLVNLRGQGAVTGTAPMNVQVNAVRVGGILSPLISVLRAVLQPGVNTSVCVQVQNLLGLDLTFLGVEMDVTAFNADSPTGVSGRVVVQTGLGGEDTSPLACADAVVLAPTANAGVDQSVADTDRQPGEMVTLNGSASSDPDGTIASYDWRNAANQQIATGPTPSVRLPDGRQTLTLIVTDNSGATASDTVNVNVTAPAANRLPNAVAGADRIVADTDSQAGENVVLDATQSSDPDGTIASYQWLLGQSTVIATGATAQVRLPDGPQVITLRVTDNSGGVATDTVNITVAAANPAVAPRASAGADRTVADSDKLAGENVVLDGTASTDADGTIVSYQWLLGGQVLATSATATVRLPDGESFLTLVVTDNSGNTASDGLLITVSSAAGLPPVADAGADQSIADSDALPGENVALNASASTDADGVIVSYQWTFAGRSLATGVTANVRLPDGNNLVTLKVVDNSGNSTTDTVQVAVAAAVNVPILSVLPGLTPNQMSVAVAMDSLCPRLDGLAKQQTLAGDQANLQAHCDAIRFGSNATEQVTALDEISPQDLNATRTQTLNLSRTQLANVADRLIALRSGARGLSLVGLNLQIDGQPVPLQQLGSLADDVMGGGASADERQDRRAARKTDADKSSVDDLLGKNVGVWLRGNYSFGNKDGSSADHGFDADQWGVVAGMDYRFAPGNVAGVALGYGQSNVSFNPVGAGRLDTRAITAAIYATMYSSNGFYVDAIANYLRSDYDSQRHIVFTEGGSPLDVTADGGTQGATVGFAFTFGYDLNFGAFTIAPSLGYNYLGSRVNDFREHGAAGLDLAYKQQNYSSGTANAGLRLMYAWKTAVAVIVPQIRGEYLREFIDDTEAFGVRFANDPFDDTPVIVVHTDATDQSYWRLAAGFSAQFRYGISGFVEYQKLQSLQYFEYSDVALGVRFETGFR